MTSLLTEQLERTADRMSAQPAAVYEDSTLDWATLSARANQLAHALRDAGVCRHDRVGIFMNKSINTPIAIYGILKAGAAYVPMDPSAPDDRLCFVARDCGIRHLVTAPEKHSTLAALASEANVEHFFGVEAAEGAHAVSWQQIHTAPGSPPSVRVNEQDLAYIIYTSGSTGTPKGIMHSHYSSTSFARWAAREYGLRSQDRVGNHSPLHFDISIFDYFAAARVGAATIIISERHTKLPASYSELLSKQRISVLFTVPFALIQLLLRGVLEERDLSELRWIIFGGEPFPSTHLANLMRALPHVAFDNMYGPAEVNGCTHYTLRELPAADAAVPIGRIASIAEAMIVDAGLSPVTPGQAGELLVRTPTMMRGYWARPDLDARAFHDVPGEPGPSRRYYRTGDLVSDGGDGELHFLGRMDRQVKVRGHRVELDEIELVLTSNPDVEEAAAYTQPGPDGSRVIKAAVTLTTNSTADRRAIGRYARAHLPWYARPERIELREQFPRTTSGKIDRRALALEAGTPDSARNGA